MNVGDTVKVKCYGERKDQTAVITQVSDVIPYLFLIKFQQPSRNGFICQWFYSCELNLIKASGSAQQAKDLTTKAVPAL